MKIYRNLYTVILSMFLVCSFTISCSSDYDTLGVNTKITNYPNFNYESLVVVPVGGSFAPNVTASEGDKDLEVQIDGTANPNSIGVYYINYSAVNSDGFAGNVTQTVIVFDPTGTGTDVSGKIKDKNNNARKGEITLVSGTPNVFYCTDFGFAGAFPLYFIMNGDNPVALPQEFLGYDPATSVVMGYDPAIKQFTTAISPYGFSYTFVYDN